MALLAPAIGTAQDQQSINCRFIALKGNTPPKLIQVGPDEIEVKIEMKTNIISRDTECFPVEGKLQFVSQDNRRPVAEVSIPKGVRDAILIFAELKKGSKKLPWQVFVIEDSPKEFPTGGTYVANFHSQNIRFIIGEEKAMLRPASSNGFPQPKERDDFNMAPVLFQFQNKRDEWVTVNETVLRFVPGLRYLMLAYVDPVTRRPQVTTVKDFKQH